MIDLYSWATPNGQKVHIMLEETGIPYRVHGVNIRTGEQFAPEFLRTTVIDKDGKPVGVVGLPDMLTLELPDFVNFIADVDFVHDFGAVETTRPSAASLARPVRKLMKPPIAVPEDCGLLRAYALIIQHNLHDMLVVSPEGKLVGIASRVDVGRAILKAWARVEKR